MSPVSCAAPEEDFPFDVSLRRLPPLRTRDEAAQAAYEAYWKAREEWAKKPQSWRDPPANTEVWCAVAKALLGDWLHKPEDDHNG